MKSALLINYAREHLESVEKHLAAYREDGEPERLHLLRVDIKKTKAVFSFFGSIHQQQYSDNRLRPLFHKAGGIRETDICLSLLVAIPGFPEKFILQLENEKKKRKEQFVKNIPRYARSVINTRAKISLPDETVHKRSVIKYFKTEMRKVKKITGTGNREDMHRLRMRLKKLMYLYDALPGKIQDDLKLNTREINKLQEKAGAWHDSYSSIGFISRQKIPGMKPGYLSGLEEKEKKQFKELVKKLREKDI